MRIAKPVDWNVVVVGFWNPAILSPAGIARRLFGLSQGTPIHVEVPLDQLMPFRVKHEGLIVTAEMGRLTITLEEPTFGSLEKAMNVASKAVNGLPETPFSAAGFNLRFELEDVPDSLIDATTPPIDNDLTDAQFDIKSRTLGRALAFRGGVINFEIKMPTDQPARVEFNFHRPDKDREGLSEWLSTPIAEVKSAVTKVMHDVVSVSLEEAKV